MSPGASDGVSPTGDLHPREHLRTHKAEIEGWNSAGWKNFFKTLDALGNAWNARKTACGPQLDQLKSQLPYAGAYQQQVQAQLNMVQQMHREAENNFGTCYIIHMFTISRHLVDQAFWTRCCHRRQIPIRRGLSWIPTVR